MIEQTPPQGSARPDGSDAGGPAAEHREDHLSYRYYEALGEAAYARAREIEKTSGRPDDPEALEAYAEAAANLTGVTWMAPNQDVMDDPVRMLRIADSLAKLVQADAVEPYSEPQYAGDGMPITLDRRQDLQRISSELFVEAGRLFTGETAQGPGDTADTDTPGGAIASALHEAGGDEDKAVVLQPDKVSHTAEFVLDRLAVAPPEAPPEAVQSEQPALAAAA